MQVIRRGGQGRFKVGIYTYFENGEGNVSNMTTKGTSDLALMELWRRAVLKHHHYRCVICGGDGKLECHHIVHRGQAKILRFDWKNGIPVHHGDCHSAANLDGWLAIPDWQRDYLRGRRALTFKAFLFAERLSESEWRQSVKAELEAKLREGA